MSSIRSAAVVFALLPLSAGLSAAQALARTVVAGEGAAFAAAPGVSRIENFSVLPLTAFGASAVAPSLTAAPSALEAVSAAAAPAAGEALEPRGAAPAKGRAGMRRMKDWIVRGLVRLADGRVFDGRSASQAGTPPARETPPAAPLAAGPRWVKHLRKKHETSAAGPRWVSFFVGRGKP